MTMARIVTRPRLLLEDWLKAHGLALALAARNKAFRCPYDKTQNSRTPTVVRVEQLEQWLRDTTQEQRQALLYRDPCVEV